MIHLGVFDLPPREEEKETVEFSDAFKIIPKKDKTGFQLVRHFEKWKPCWELNYCPYGSLVETFPLPPPTEDELKNLSEEERDFFQKEESWFYELSEKDQQYIHKGICSVFGHLCPVFFVFSPFVDEGAFEPEKDK